jgi:hypothetical protein
VAYVDVQDLRNEGVAEPTYSDAWCQDRIALAQAYIEKRLSPLFFERRDAVVLRVDSRGHNTIFLAVPPIDEDAISEVAIIAAGVDPVVIDADTYEVDADRDCPRLIRTVGLWPKGSRNLRLTGSFGYIEWTTAEPPVAVTPRLIRDLTIRLAVYDLEKAGEAVGSKSDRIISETKSDYSYKLSELTGSGGDFGDNRIDRVMAMFRPSTMSTL